MIESENLSYGMKEHQEAVTRWKERFQAFEGSGMTQTAWCQENQVSMASFSKWKKRFQKTDQESTKNELCIESPSIHGSEARSSRMEDVNSSNN